MTPCASGNKPYRWRCPDQQLETIFLHVDAGFEDQAALGNGLQREVFGAPLELGRVGFLGVFLLGFAEGGIHEHLKVGFVAVLGFGGRGEELDRLRDFCICRWFCRTNCRGCLSSLRPWPQTPRYSAWVKSPAQLMQALGGVGIAALSFETVDFVFAAEFEGLAVAAVGVGGAVGVDGLGFFNGGVDFAEVFELGQEPTICLGKMAPSVRFFDSLRGLPSWSMSLLKPSTSSRIATSTEMRQ
jgi:hypothetical protein